MRSGLFFVFRFGSDRATRKPNPTESENHMPFFSNGDGSATHLDWVLDRSEILRRLENKETYFGTLAGAVLYGGVQATAFDKPLRAVKVYHGTEAMAAVFAHRPLPEPVGLKSEYRVVVLDGQFYHPPLHPAQAAA